MQVTMFSVYHVRSVYYQCLLPSEKRFFGKSILISFQQKIMQRSIECPHIVASNIIRIERIDFSLALNLKQNTKSEMEFPSPV